MITPEQCETFAEACLKIAERSAEEDKKLLEEVALAWRRRAEEIRLRQPSAV
jgi:hypothetical protein